MRISPNYYWLNQSHRCAPAHITHHTSDRYLSKMTSNRPNKCVEKWSNVCARVPYISKFVRLRHRNVECKAPLDIGFLQNGLLGKVTALRRSDQQSLPIERQSRPDQTFSVESPFEQSGLRTRTPLKSRKHAPADHSVMSIVDVCQITICRTKWPF